MLPKRKIYSPKSLNLLEDIARKWLLKQVKKKTNRKDFEILHSVCYMPTSTNKVYDGSQVHLSVKSLANASECFCFRCKYKWQLNAEVKSVETDIFVVYSYKTQEFYSTDSVLD